MLRYALEPDSQILASIWRGAWASANPGVCHIEPLEHWLTRVRTEFNAPNQTFVYEASGGDVLAFMVVNTGDAYLHQLFVHTRSQRTGIGSELLAHLCALCPTGWSLHVAQSNDRARRFYARHGLVEGPVSHHPVTGRERLLYSWKPQRFDFAMQQLEFTSVTPDPQDFKSLYDTTGWGPVSRPATYYAGALSGSWYTQAVYSDGQLIGFARVISDGHLHAFITEMIVHPEFQRLGIGASLLSSVLDACHNAGITDIQLFSARGKTGFYERHDFVCRPIDGPGMQFSPVA